jgi:hypothetical protein
MFFLFGKKTRARPVANGRTVTGRCPGCETIQQLHEVERESTYTAYIAIDLFSSKERAFACASCGEVVDADEIASTPPPRDERAEREAREAATQRREAEKQRREAEKKTRAREVDEELAELKKRLGK